MASCTWRMVEAPRFHSTSRICISRLLSLGSFMAHHTGTAGESYYVVVALASRRRAACHACANGNSAWSRALGEVARQRRARFGRQHRHMAIVLVADAQHHALALVPESGDLFRREGKAQPVDRAGLA